MSTNLPNKIITLSKFSMDRRLPANLKITNIKPFRPPDAKLAKKKQEESLRAELHKEIESRSRACTHKGHKCTLPVLSGKEYCARHILEDPTAPYKQCAHAYANGERCPLPAPVPTNTQHDNRRDQGLCFEHARAALASRHRAAAPPPPITTAETLLNQLQHYVKAERARSTSCASAVSVVSESPGDNSDQLVAPHALDPFKEIDAVCVNAASCAALMECASASDSDADSVTLGRGGSHRGGHDEDLSGDEETAYDRDPLRYAGVFTAEEAVHEARTALRLLQAGYTRQLARLARQLKAARAKYLRSLKHEREHYCSINTQARGGGLTARERRQLRKLKAFAAYHTRRGTDAVLARKLHRKRARAADLHGSSRVPGANRCHFTDYGARCESRSLPAARHCLKHVIHEKHQVLFVPCGDHRGPGPGLCREPVPQLPVPALACRYHTDPPHYAAITLKKGESDSELISESDNEGEQGAEHPPGAPDWPIA